MQQFNFFMRSAAALTFVGSLSAPAFTQTNPLPLAGDANAYPARVTITTKVYSPIVMKVLPKGTCLLHVEGSNDSAKSLNIFADDDGFVRFYVQPLNESDQTARFQIDCQADGKSATFPLELRASALPTADMPAPVSEIPRKADAKFRPALTADDAAQLGIDELVKRGYPPRPDPQQAPGAYSTWLKAVTQAAKIVSPRLVPHPGVTHKKQQVTASPATAYNWSGYELRSNRAYTFDDIIGSWSVPTILIGESGTWTYSTFWIGLDGDPGDDPACQTKNYCDLVQEGTEQDLLELCPFVSCFDFTNYIAWTEFLPQQGIEQSFPNISISPGDQIFAQVQMCSVPSAACQDMDNGPYAVFWMDDMTHPQAGIVTVSRGSYYVGGYEAEWIMERPTQPNNSFPDLAFYGIAVMNNAYACNSVAAVNSLTCMDYSSPISGVTSEQLWMYDQSNGHLLSVALPNSPTSILFQWVNWH